MPTPEEVEIEAKQSELNELERLSEERELELSNLADALKSFEDDYLTRVGALYVELDEINSEVAALLAARFPAEKQARKNAKTASQKAKASRIEFNQLQEKSVAASNKTEECKKLYRKAALKLHPDHATDESDRARRRDAMVRVNKAYEQGDIEGIQRILDEWDASPDGISEGGLGADLIRLIRRLWQVRRRLAAIEEEFEAIRSSDMFQLYQQYAEAKEQGEDLIAELAREARDEVNAARDKLEALRKEFSR